MLLVLFIAQSASRCCINASRSVHKLELAVPGSPPTPAATAAWDELTTALRDCILRAHPHRVEQYMSEIRKLDAQSKLPGWNFCTYFVAQEGLAFVHEQTGLLGAAIDIYGALEVQLRGTSTRVLLSFASLQFIFVVMLTLNHIFAMYCVLCCEQRLISKLAGWTPRSKSLVRRAKTIDR